MILLLIGLIWLDHRLAQRVAEDWTPRLLINVGLLLHEGLVVTLVVAVLVVFAAGELSRLLRAAGAQPATGWATVACLGLVLIPWLVRNAIDAEISADVSTDYRYSVNWLAASVLGTFVAIGMRRRTEGAVAAIGATLLIIVYLGVLMSFVVRLRMWSSPWLLLYVLFVVKICDIGAFFTGLALGRTKLIAWLSPKKTWEGLAGGVAASVLLAIGLARLGMSHGPADLRIYLPSVGHAAIFGAVMALVGQAGDLGESLLKRDAGAKDSGAVVPSFGGLLDIIDSPVFAAPLAYWMLVR